MSMIILAIDTSDQDGSVALLRDSELLGIVRHVGDEDYSSWLLPAISGMLQAAEVLIPDVELFAVSTGPGSFTGVRIALSAVKAWSEVFGRPIAAVSRLEAIAEQAAGSAIFIAAFANAYRGQMYGACYRRSKGGLQLVAANSAGTAEKFMERALEQAAGEQVCWISPHPRILEELPEWGTKKGTGGKIVEVTTELAPLVGKAGWQKALRGQTTDALSLDADYVSRPDAEIFWKVNAKKLGSTV